MTPGVYTITAEERAWLRAEQAKLSAHWHAFWFLGSYDEIYIAESKPREVKT